MRKAQVGNIYKASMTSECNPNYHIQREKAIRDGVRMDVFDGYVRFLERHLKERSSTS